MLIRTNISKTKIRIILKLARAKQKLRIESSEGTRIVKPNQILCRCFINKNG